MSILSAFNPPGNLTDLNNVGLEIWNNFVSDRTDEAIAGSSVTTHNSPRSQYYNLTKTDTDADATTADVSWTAFPRQVKIRSVSDRQRWMIADKFRDVQDEYCEWNVVRNGAGKILNAQFTCESYEYWTAIALSDPQKLVALYQEFVDPRVKKADLFDSEENYITRNRWNTDTENGAMHLVQAANTLGAEIELCAAATIVREINGEILTSEQELIRCGRYGEPERNSDPHIGGVVNSIAQQAADISLANPVGLYFDDLSTAGWTTPDGTDPKLFWKYIRGDANHPVRAVFEVPKEAGYTVSDITILGEPIIFASQIADHISIKATIIACRFGKSTANPFTACVGDEVDILSALAAPAMMQDTSRLPMRLT